MTQVYITDDRMNPVPVGIPGELFASGSGVGRGYINNPELTKERFIDNPFRDNSVLYKTGDLARYLPNGDIEYLGRADGQVKIRGYRIELGEIESEMQSIPGISEALVIDRFMSRARKGCMPTM
jgi:non-ribosomal peptide synthetase component F